MGTAGIVLVHDYLTQRGGAERVVLSMLKAFPGAPLYTSLYAPESTFGEFADHDVRPLWPNRLAALRRDHRRGLLVFPFAFTALRLDAEVVLCSSSGFAHGVRTTGRKVVYCHTPARWLYDQQSTYLAGWPSAVSAGVRAASPVLARWDRWAASSATSFLTNSTVGRDRIRRAYGVEAQVLPPPASPAILGDQRGLPGVEPGFVLCIARLLAYKNVDAVVAAFDRLTDQRLVVVGDGPERAALRAAAGPNVAFLDRVGDAELAWLYANCAAVVSAAYEDFGLTAVEASSCGKPVAVLRAGGFLDTVIDGESGVFFDEPLPAAIAAAVRSLLHRSWDAGRIKRSAESFSEASFADRLRDAVH